MQEAIKEIAELWDSPSDKPIYSQIFKVLEDKLEKEKEQIIDAHIEGQRVFDNHQHTQWTNDQAEEYYNQTYNQNK